MVSVSPCGVLSTNWPLFLSVVWSAGVSVKLAVPVSTLELARIESTELRSGEEGEGFGCSVPGLGPASTASPCPMVM